MRRLATLLRKDLRIELRNREGLTLILGHALLLSLIASFAVGSAFLNPLSTSRVFPGLVWMIFLFAATLCIGRSYDHELVSSAMDGIRLCGVPAELIYLSKVLGNFCLIFFSHVITLIVLGVLLNVPVGMGFLQLLLVSVPVIFAYAALATLLAAVAATSRLKGMLLPLILLPLVFPILISGIELFQGILESGALPLDAVWIPLLLVADVVYFVAGINLFPILLKD
ncbi:MAG: heme exporter protein CcmB [Oligoflexia bacterium]|nr:heme exporter protein CcmB [Oligoflexia bacterium]